MKPSDLIGIAEIRAWCGMCKKRRARSGLFGKSTIRHVCHVCFALENPDLHVVSDAGQLLFEAVQEVLDARPEHVNCRCTPSVVDDRVRPCLFDMQVGIECDCGVRFERRVRMNMNERREIRCGKCRARFEVTTKLRLVIGETPQGMLIVDRVPKRKT